MVLPYPGLFTFCLEITMLPFKLIFFAGGCLVEKPESVATTRPIYQEHRGVSVHLLPQYYWGPAQVSECFEPSISVHSRQH